LPEGAWLRDVPTRRRSLDSGCTGPYSLSALIKDVPGNAGTAAKRLRLLRDAFRRHEGS